MTTAQYVSWLSKRIAGNLFSRQDLVDAINMVQNEILGRDIKFMRINPDAYLHTIAGTYQYTASTSLYSGVDNATQYDIRAVKRVYAYNITKSSIFAYGGILRRSHRPDRLVNPMNSDELDIDFDEITSSNPSVSDCKINLWSENDPGTNTTLYRAVAYRWPTQVLSESIQMTLPVQFQRGLLRYGIMRDLEYTEFGEADKPEILFDRELAKFDAWSAGIKNTSSGTTAPREC